jgi:hypothetical protein
LPGLPPLQSLAPDPSFELLKSKSQESQVESLMQLARGDSAALMARYGTMGALGGMLGRRRRWSGLAWLRRQESNLCIAESQTASASRIRFVIASGCEISARWLASISIVFAPIRLAMKRSRSGLIVRSWVDTA